MTLLETAALVQVRGLVMEFAARGPGRTASRVRAVAGVDLDIRTGEVYGLVGESGSGKTTLARCLLRLLPPTAGSIAIDGVDVAKLRGGDLRRLRREVQVVFQDPVGSLDPRVSVGDIVAEPIRLHTSASRAEAEKQVRVLLDEVGLGPQHLGRRPHELSGGQCQRVAIARALALRPRLVVLDEPTSALAGSVQAQILNLLGDLRRAHGLTYLLISHDLSVVRYLCDRIGVMYLGRIVEQGPATRVFESPRHPYTRALLSAAPDVDGGRRRRVLVQGDPPSPVDHPSGCPFHPRCWLYAERGNPGSCRTTPPTPIDLGLDHAAACWFADEVASAIVKEVSP